MSRFLGVDRLEIELVREAEDCDVEDFCVKSLLALALRLTLLLVLICTVTVPAAEEDLKLAPPLLLDAGLPPPNLLLLLLLGCPISRTVMNPGSEFGPGNMKTIKSQSLCGCLRYHFLRSVNFVL